MTASPSHSTVSLDTLNGKSYALGGKSSKLPHWQAELHGCEAQLANAQRSLEAKRVSAVRDGLRLRATAMIECGTRWTEAGRAILQMNADGMWIETVVFLIFIVIPKHLCHRCLI